MDAFDDVELDRTQGSISRPPQRQSRAAAAGVLVALVAAVSLGWWWWARSSQPAPAAQRAAVVSTPAPPPAVAPAPVLPPLDDLDPVVRQLINGLTASPLLAGWLGTTNLVRQVAALVAGAAGAEVPLRLLAPIRPGGGFAVEHSQGRTVVSDATFRRATPLVDVIAGLDAAALARAYRTLSPRLEDAYAELADDDRTFDVALREALDQLVAAPVGDRVEVVERAGTYFFADPKLEALTPTQKLLLRTGPDNARKLQAQLRALRAQLDRPPTS